MTAWIRHHPRTDPRGGVLAAWIRFRVIPRNAVDILLDRSERSGVRLPSVRIRKCRGGLSAIHTLSRTLGLAGARRAELVLAVSALVSPVGMFVATSIAHSDIGHLILLSEIVLAQPALDRPVMGVMNPVSAGEG